MKIERRTISSENTRATRSSKSDRAIEGYAATFDSETIIGGLYRERIAPGAFDTVNDGPVVATFNHDTNWTIGSTRSGTCAIEVNETGLHYRVQVPEGPIGDHVLAITERGDLGGSSFAFVPHANGERWVDPSGDETLPLRVLESVQVFDVSAVVSPAYESSSVSMAEARSRLDTYQAQKQDQEDQTVEPASGAATVEATKPDAATANRRRRLSLHEKATRGKS
jgi:HK97 family phage prohead protease